MQFERQSQSDVFWQDFSRKVRQEMCKVLQSQYQSLYTLMFLNLGTSLGQLSHVTIHTWTCYNMHY